MDSSSQFDLLFQVLLDRRAVEEPFDASDEHERFRLYKAALAEGDLVDEVIGAVTEEQDAALQEAMFVKLLETVPGGERQRVLSASTGSPFLGRRASELDLLETLQAKPGLTATEEEAVTEGSDWLQRNLAERVLHAPTLEFLSRSGRTKRIRAAAAHRYRELSP